MRRSSYNRYAMSSCYSAVCAYYESIVYVSVYKREMHQLSVSPRLVKVVIAIIAFA